VIPSDGLAILASAFYGSGDFLGGWAARRASAFTVTFAAGVPGLVTLLVAWPFTGGVAGAHDLGWGVAAGVFGSLGVALLYRAYAIGPVSVAAPLISLVALSVPILVGVTLGERPSRLALAGIALAAAAFPFLARVGKEAASEPHAGAMAGAHVPAAFVGPSAEPSAHVRAIAGAGLPGARARASEGWGMIPTALVSGILVGGFLVAIGRVSPGAGLLPLVVARMTMLVLFAGLLAARRLSPWPSRSSRATIASGVLDSLANVSYFAALHHGALTLVATIVSLSPAVTVLLARVVLHERWSGSQRAGLVLAAVAIVCVSMG
jgi:drug/metabolite transporter (DMT)-like permease